MAVLRGDTLIVPVFDPRSVQVVFVSASKRSVTDRLTLPRGSVAAVMRVHLITDAQHWEEVALQTAFGFATQRALGTVFAAASTAGVIHVCAPTGAGARRYIVTPDRKSTIAGTECGPMTSGAGGADILLARRDPAQLLVLDPTTGRPTRTLPLAGAPARLIC